MIEVNCLSGKCGRLWELREMMTLRIVLEYWFPLRWMKYTHVQLHTHYCSEWSSRRAAVLAVCMQSLDYSSLQFKAVFSFQKIFLFLGVWCLWRHLQRPWQLWVDSLETLLKCNNSQELMAQPPFLKGKREAVLTACQPARRSVSPDKMTQHGRLTPQTFD